MRVSLVIATSKIIEMQTSATPGTLLQNAIGAGYAAEQVEERVVTAAEYATLRALPINQPPSPEQTDLESACIAGAATPPPPIFGFDLHRAFIAHVISCEAYRLNKSPGTLTGAELAAIRQRVANIYKAL